MKKNTFKSLQSSFQLICVICIAILFFGCARVSLKSVRDPSFSNSINKLFILLNHGQVGNIDPAYTSYLKAALWDEFSKEGVEISIRVVAPLDLDTSVYKSEIASYKPDGVLTINVAGGIGSSKGIPEIIYDVSLIDLPTNKRVWRAQINASGDKYVRDRRMKLVARDLVKQLKEEKLISSESRIKGK